MSAPAWMAVSASVQRVPKVVERLGAVEDSRAVLVPYLAATCHKAACGKVDIGRAVEDTDGPGILQGPDILERRAHR
jgi:hypothetical protein